MAEQRTKFNANNTGYIKGRYNLFCDEQLGLADTINVTYPKLDSLYQKQVSQIWNEFEVDLTQDRMDMTTLPYSIVRPMQQTISWQALADAVAARSISSLLMKHITNPELENLVNLWAFFETIHNKTYAHIIKKTFEDPQEMMRDTYENAQVLMRSESIVRAFDKLEQLADDAPILEVKTTLLTAMVALFALESIAFMASFAVTFGIAELGVFQGISQLVTLICRDEILHTHMGLEVMSTLRDEEGWGPIFAICQGQVLEMLTELTQQEMDWADHIFIDGAIPGLSATLLKQEVAYRAYPTFQFFGLGDDFPFEIVKEPPLKYMSKYLNTSNIQVAAQELQLTAYQIGIISDNAQEYVFDEADLMLDLKPGMLINY
ncbi:putative ribonucleoside-diphosphate reductase 1 subunit beta [Vibrio phage 70E35.2]|nr:putative ribonucleoside-diphosphate reductase 1 subunit beta [Vibrio phage 70E35.2]